MPIRYVEKDGTAGSDALVGSNGAITFGLQGNDTLQGAPNPTATEALSGGAGSDTYIAAFNTLITIADMGNGAPNTLVATGIGLNSATSFAAIVDGRHFYAFDTSSREQVLVLDWLDPRNKLDTVVLRDGTFTFDQLVTAVNQHQLGPNFAGNITWAQSGLLLPGQTVSDINEAIAYYEQRGAALINAVAINPLEQALIDPNFYEGRYADIAAADVDPAQHFVATGWREGRLPDLVFDPVYYLQHNPDVAAAGIDPLLHYATSGWKEGRDPSAAFSTSHYLQVNPDVKLAGVDPLQHYLQFGIAEHRPL